MLDFRWSLSRTAIRGGNAVLNVFMKYQAVIFDLFGTLVDIFTRQEYEKVLAEMVDILKAPHDSFNKLWYQTAKKRAIGEFRTLEDNLEYIVRELKIPFSKNQIENACKVRMDFATRALAPKPDAITTLARIKSEGCKIALISNCSTEPPVLWADTPFALYFDTAIFSSTCGLQKPDPRIYFLGTEKLSVKPKDCLYIGDGDGNELTGAAQVGMRPVLIRNPREDKQNVIRTGYQGDSWDGEVIYSLSDVLRLLE
jgi:putative hydrolase of the HAD superfamily